MILYFIVEFFVKLGGTSQPANEVMVKNFSGTEYDTGPDRNLFADTANKAYPV